MKVEVNIFNENQFEVAADEIRQLTQKIWRTESDRAAVINIVLVDLPAIQELNRRFLQKSAATDVISFPITDEDNFFEGEVYICFDQIQKNAGEYGVSVHEELRRVVAHGILHFLGYDDHNHADKKRMSLREDHYLFN